MPPLGPFELGEALGAGGFGRVFRGLDPRTGEEVAVKVHPEGGRALARLHREHLLGHRVDHPAFPAPRELGPLPGGEGGWLALDLAPGGAPTAAARGRPPAFVGGLLLDALDALAALHGAGLVHGDLKDANLRVTADGGVSVLDLGGAHPAGRRDPLGEVRTPRWASPEQRAREPVDARSDLFTLGRLAARWLTGVRPEPDEPLVPLPAEVPASLAGLVAALAAPDPRDRPASARAAAARLRAAGFAGRGWATPATPDGADDGSAGRLAAALDRGGLGVASDVGLRPGPAARAVRARAHLWGGRLRCARRDVAGIGTPEAEHVRCRLAEILGERRATDDLRWRARLRASAGDLAGAADDEARLARAFADAPDGPDRAALGTAWLAARAGGRQGGPWPAHGAPDEPWLCSRAGRMARLERLLVAARGTDDALLAAWFGRSASRLARWLGSGLPPHDAVGLTLFVASQGGY